MKFVEQKIKDVWVIEPVRHGDSRGYFSETFRQDLFDENVGKVTFVQDNESYSCRGVVRGLHFQKGDAAQAKLVRVSQGEIYDIVVDLRKESPTLGQHVMVNLSAENGRQLYMPRGMAHGFVVISDFAKFQYKVDNFYAPDAEGTLLYNDPALGIEYPIPFEEMIVSDKDCKGMPLVELLDEL